MNGPRTRFAGSNAHRAALWYLEGDCTLRQAADRYGVGTTSVHDALCRIRDKQTAERNVWPEDEVTC